MTVDNVVADDQFGPIEVDKKADIILPEQNLFEIDPEKIPETKVLTTMFDGNIVHDVAFGIGDSKPACVASRASSGFGSPCADLRR